jgi:hypothetical protein
MIFITGLLLAACSGLQVTSDYDKTENFDEHKTLEYYGWQDESDQILNRFDKERIEEAFGNEFRKRGIEVVEENADIIVSLFIVTKEKTQTTANTTHMGGGYGGHYGYGPGYGWGTGHSSTTISEYEYTEGTLIVSVYDAKEKKLVWEGVGKGTINENPKKREEGIKRAAAAIMAKYPKASLQE